MTINQPGQTNDPVEQSWKLEVTRAINDLQANPAVAAGTTGVVRTDPLTVTVTIYQRALIAPTTPNSTTFDRDSGATVPAGWSLLPPAPDGVPVYSSIAEVVGSTESSPTLEWQDPELTTQDGNKTYIRYAAKLDATRQDSELLVNTVVSDRTTFTPGATSDPNDSDYNANQGFSAWPTGDIELNSTAWTYTPGNDTEFYGLFSGTPNAAHLAAIGRLTPDTEVDLTGQTLRITFQRTGGNNSNNTVRIRTFNSNGVSLGATGGVVINNAETRATAHEVTVTIGTFTASPTNPLYVEMRIQTQDSGQNAIYQVRELELSVPQGTIVPYASIFTNVIQTNTRFIGVQATTNPTPSVDGADYTWSRYRTEVGTGPSSSSSLGEEGDIAADSTYFYYYTGNRWQRVAWDTTNW